MTSFSRWMASRCLTRPSWSTSSSSHGEKPILFHVIREGKVHLSVEVTPERRKKAEVSVLTNQSMNAVFDFEVARPGGIFHRYKNTPLPGQSGERPRYFP